MENIFGNRLQSARKMAGISLQELSDRLDNRVSKQALSKYEQGIMKPGSSMIIALSDALNVTVDYLLSPPHKDIVLSNISYRKYSSKISKTVQYAIEEKARDIYERYLELESLLQIEESGEYFHYKKTIKNAADAEAAAKELRIRWNLGYDPIPDVVEMLEDKGYRIIELDAPEGFDGLKANIGKRKVLVLNSNKNRPEDIVRKRFTALHELAHHALVFSETLTEKQEEHLCHSFASAVLYPEDMAKKEMHRDRFHFYQNELVFMKERWGISFPAIFNRALHLGIINDYVFKSVNMVYRARKLHLKEPGKFLSREKPLRFEKLIYLGLSKEAITVNEAAFFAGKSLGEFRKKITLLV